MRTERVIFEVQSRPLLWDKYHEHYKNRDARIAAWREICEEIVPDFENYTEDEQKDIDKKIQQRWRTARDMYKKEKMAESQGAKKRKKYEYFGNLTFLDGSINETNDMPEASEMVLLTCSPITEWPSPSQSTPASPSTSAWSNLSAPAQKRNNATSSSENISLEYLKNNQLELESEDLAFFLSLQPTLKRLTNYQKMMFRTRVMQVVMEMEMEMPEIQTVKSELE